MPEVTKKHRIDEEMVTIHLRVHRSNAPKIKEYARAIELDDNKKTYTIDEVFPEYIDKKPQIAIRAYRYRENLTQKQLAQLTGIPQRHLSEMENGKRAISKEIAKTLATALNTDYQMFL